MVYLEVAWTRGFSRSAPRNRVIKRVHEHSGTDAMSMTHTGHAISISPTVLTWVYTSHTRARGHNGTYGAPPTLRPVPAWPWATARPSPTRPEPPRSRPPLLTAAISRRRDPARGSRALSALARPPPGGSDGRRGRPARATHASDAAAGATTRAGRPRERAAAVAARPARLAALRGQPDRHRWHAAVALRRR